MSKRKRRASVTAEGVALAEPSEWPEGVPPPVDCTPIRNKRTKIDVTTAYWESSTHKWTVPTGWQEHTIEWVERNYGTGFHYAKCKFSKENPPPIPEGYELVASGGILAGDMIYCAGQGWSKYEGGPLYNTVMLNAAPIHQVPEGYRKLGPEEWTLPHRDVAFVGGLPVVFTAHLQGKNTRGVWRPPLAIPTGFTEVGDVNARMETPGAIAYHRTARYWAPWVGPFGDRIIDLICAYANNLFTGIATLNADQIPEGWEQLDMGQALMEGDGVLTEAGWLTIASASPFLGRPSYLFDNSLALRRRKPSGPEQERVPAEVFMSAELLNMLINNPNAPQFRGLVRREHKMIIPAELATSGSSAAIRLWLERQYFSVYGAARGAGFVNVFDARARASRRAGTVRPPELPVDIEYVTARVELDEYITGRASLSRRDHHGGEVDVPRSIVDQGDTAVRRWVREHFRDGALDLERETGDTQYNDEEDVDYSVDLADITVAYEQPADAF